MSRLPRNAPTLARTFSDLSRLPGNAAQPNACVFRRGSESAREPRPHAYVFRRESASALEPRPHAYVFRLESASAQRPNPYAYGFGEGAIFYATSEDLIHWTPCPADQPIYRPTPGEWDEKLVEIGATPVLSEDGLLIFMINGARDGEQTRVDYRCGQIAIALNEPTQVIAKMTRPWLRPQTVEELNGLVSNVTFVEGLVWFRDRWLAYYGQSDTTLAVAEYVPARDSYR